VSHSILSYGATDNRTSIDGTHHKLPHGELIKCEAMEAFNKHFGEDKDRKKIVELVKEQQESESKGEENCERIPKERVVMTMVRSVSPSNRGPWLVSG
jgi:hypothetical protein